MHHCVEVYQLFQRLYGKTLEPETLKIKLLYVRFNKGVMYSIGIAIYMK